MRGVDQFSMMAADSIAASYIELAHDAELTKHEILVIGELAQLLLGRVVSPNDRPAVLAAQQEAQAIMDASTKMVGEN